MARWLILLGLTMAAVLVPFALWGDRIETWAVDVLASKPAWWTIASLIFALLAADVVLPVPSSLVATASGALLGFAGGATVTWTGMMAGCLLGYWLGLRSPSERWLGPAEARRLRAACEAWGVWMLAAMRPVPVLAEASVFFAGLSRMPTPRFAAITGLANLGIAIVYAATGAWARGRESFLLAFALAVLLPGAAMLATRRRSGA